MSRISDGRNHAQADVTFVADPLSGVDAVHDARAAQGSAVVTTALVGVRDPAQPAGQITNDLDVQAGHVVLAGVELCVNLPARAADQRAIDDQLLIAGSSSAAG
jgi:hypothetical protein